MNGKQTSPDPLVTVVVTAYNQADLVERCLDSVAAQKTSFGVRIVVADDASTDGTADVVRAWSAKRPEVDLELIAREANLGLDGNPAEALRHVRTPFFHILESDDYWCDESKLQRQVDALDAHPECIACGHSTEYRKMDGELVQVKGRRLKDGAFRVDDLFTTQFVHRSAVLFRNFLDEISDDDLSWIVRDVCFFYYALSKGKIIYFDRPMSVYSITGIGTWSGLSAEKKKERLQCLYYRLDRYFGFKYTAKFRHQYLPHEGKKLFSFAVPYLRKGRRLIVSFAKWSRSSP
jgi:glycosyltransferase involved in cell wall biosynthesis